jgi:hypothetical protein
VRSEHPSDVKFEIGHVLFLDIVGYSKLLITEQSEQLQALKEIVRGTEQFRNSIAHNAGNCGNDLFTSYSAATRQGA